MQTQGIQKTFGSGKPTHAFRTVGSKGAEKIEYAPPKSINGCFKEAKKIIEELECSDESNLWKIVPIMNAIKELAFNSAKKPSDIGHAVAEKIRSPLALRFNSKRISKRCADWTDQEAEIHSEVNRVVSQLIG